jgi:hypothetical protein
MVEPWLLTVAVNIGKCEILCSQSFLDPGIAGHRIQSRAISSANKDIPFGKLSIFDSLVFIVMYVTVTMVVTGDQATACFEKSSCFQPQWLQQPLLRSKCKGI